MSTPDKFKVGDRIKHRASGEIAIVTEVETRCTKHSPYEHITMNFSNSATQKTNHDLAECWHEETGMVTVSTGFNESTQIDAMELEAAE